MLVMLVFSLSLLASSVSHITQYSVLGLPFIIKSVFYGVITMLAYSAYVFILLPSYAPRDLFHLESGILQAHLQSFDKLLAYQLLSSRTVSIVLLFLQGLLHLGMETL